MTVVSTITFGPNNKITHRTPVSELVERVLTNSKQPLTIREVIEFIYSETGHRYRPQYVRLALQELVRARLVSKRAETEQDRVIRTGSSAVRGVPANLFWAPCAETVPARTEAISAPARKTVRKTVRKHSPVPAKAKSKVQARGEQKTLTGDAITLIEILVQERTMKLTAEVADLRDKLNAISRITQA